MPVPERVSGLSPETSTHTITAPPEFWDAVHDLMRLPQHAGVIVEPPLPPRLLPAAGHELGHFMFSDLLAVKQDIVGSYGPRAAETAWNALQQAVPRLSGVSGDLIGEAHHQVSARDVEQLLARLYKATGVFYEDPTQGATKARMWQWVKYHQIAGIGPTALRMYQQLADIRRQQYGLSPLRFGADRTMIDLADLDRTAMNGVSITSYNPNIATRAFRGLSKVLLGKGAYGFDGQSATRSSDEVTDFSVAAMRAYVADLEKTAGFSLERVSEAHANKVLRDARATPANLGYRALLLCKRTVAAKAGVSVFL